MIETTTKTIQASEFTVEAYEELVKKAYETTVIERITREFDDSFYVHMQSGQKYAISHPTRAYSMLEAFVTGVLATQP